MTAKSGEQAVANGRDVTRYEPPGYCQKYVRDPCWRVPSLYGSAIEAWNGAEFKHPGDRNPPVGAPVYYRGGNYGHAVISVGGGRIRSTDCQSSTQVNDAALSWPETAWNYEFLGWTEDLNGVRLPLDIESGGGNGGDEMPEYVSVETGPIKVKDTDWISVAWETVNADSRDVVNPGDRSIRIPNRTYIATMSAEIDVASGERISTRSIEVKQGSDPVKVEETNRLVEHPRTAGGTFIQDTRTGRVGDDRGLRWQISLPDAGSIVKASLVVVYW
jgi:hypothetical protein